jgi:hypothetical protein
LARAYGLAVVPRTVALSEAESSGPVQAVSPVRPELPSLNNTVSGIRRLVAGQVPGRVDFSGEQPEPGLTIYRNPADRNTAATGVAAGRVLDVNG